MIEESKKTIASYQPVIDIAGLVYKGLIPATFGTETAARFEKSTGIYLRQIAPAHLLRNKKNQPDEYEAGILKALAQEASRPNDSAASVLVTDDGRTLPCSCLSTMARRVSSVMASQKVNAISRDIREKVPMKVTWPAQ